MADELAKAITRIIYPALKPLGFSRARRRDLVRVENGIAQRLYFQVSAWGGREFCVTPCINLIAANDVVALAPGFRLTRDTDGGDLWLPAKTAEDAKRSASVVLGSIEAEALSFFEGARTLEGLYRLLAAEKWASTHHLSFQLGAVSAAMGDVSTARRHLVDAIDLYEADGADWSASYIDRARELLQGLANGQARDLLCRWERANCKAHGIKVA